MGAAILVRVKIRFRNSIEKPSGVSIPHCDVNLWLIVILICLKPGFHLSMAVCGPSGRIFYRLGGLCDDVAGIVDV